MQKKVTLLIETQYFAPVSTYSLIKNKCGSLLIEQCENYQKKSFRNKCLIAGANGVQPLVIPLQSGKNAKQPIRDVRIANVERWQVRHWQTIRSAYGKSPFFDYFADIFDPVFNSNYRFLFDLNDVILHTILSCLKLQSSIDYTESYIKHYDDTSVILDYRNQFPGFNGTSDTKRYPQVFEDRHGFIPGLSILDLLFCMGPDAVYYL